ncbi:MULTISPECIES: hypothetical protein [unclassified Bradyrhizobium]|uniref:hypothetical protein n=1 Tax=unclassified Bradyrhizobium TaxID=2631580 RepID=UPI00211F2F32|nr:MULTISPECIES: hypothetical protein [unclassified Bradyrhizobium]MDD1534549.1 hypothetical protein [Bradyrhizobium sp. WBOS8]MDD1581413.1 hypothetical protein [Bradyrhizobium sp. WBOS4]UUO49703.1 hypothetical protein DCM78_24010 [Bradyrhizobium sp. WBOS04]UUO58468.1 hypothetical protein DCM80_04285 [Bradyrhizobium sp. WBOS08]
MTAFPSYSTGTVSVDSGDTAIVGAGTIWSGVNARAGDDIVIDGHTVIVQDVIDETHIAIDAWPYGNVAAGTAYKIVQRSPLRFAGGQAMADVSALVAALNTDGFYVFVGPALSVPDPSYGNDGQYAFQPSTAKLWVKTAGAWSFVGTYKGFGTPAPYDNAHTYSLMEVATSGGSSYVWINPTPGAGHAPPNATYWAVLAAKGDAATVDVGTVTTGAGGSAASVENSGSSSAAVLDFTIPAGKGYGGTSTSSLTIGAGSKVFATQAGLAYQDGARVRATATAGATGWLEGVVTYSGTTLTITSDKTGGSGTGTAWNFNATGEPGAGDLSAGNNLSELSNKSAARDNLGVPQTYGQCRLKLSGADLVLTPCNGNLLTIAGTPHPVPDAGVSLPATGLTPSTDYYIYAYMNSGVMTLEASATGHATSTTSGNKGTEIKAGDDTRSLVGFARVVTGPAWADSAAQRFVRTWFNDGGAETTNTISAGARPTLTTVSPSFSEIHSSYRIETLLWAGERWVIDGAGGGWLGAAGAVYFAAGVDSSSTPEQGGCFGNSSAAGVVVSLGLSSVKTGLSEGYHYATMLGAVSSNTATYITSGVDPLGCSIRGLTRR